jgi:hypothetical protein
MTIATRCICRYYQSQYLDQLFSSAGFATAEFLSEAIDEVVDSLEQLPDGLCALDDAVEVAHGNSLANKNGRCEKRRWQEVRHRTVRVFCVFCPIGDTN